MEYKKYNFNSFNIYTINTDKFKNCHIEVVFRNKIQKDKIMIRKFLMELMSYTTKKYSTQRQFSIALEDLYNTSYYGLISRVGGCLFTTFCYDFLNPKYCEKGYLDEIINLIHETILNPNIENNEFDNESFKAVKNNILEEIKSSKENIKAYSYRRLFQFMDEDAYLAYDMVGTSSQAQKITPIDVATEYYNMLDHDYCDIYIIGSLDMDYMAQEINKLFNLRVIKEYEIPIFYDAKIRNKIQIKKEQDNIIQTNLLVGCNLQALDEEQREITAYLYNFILGAGSLDTKLGKYLRQDNSLCYTVSSIYQKYDGVILIYAGIDYSKEAKAIKLIKKALKEMTVDITVEELENAKLSLITSLNMIYDSPSSLVNNYLFLNVAKLKTVEQRIQMLQNITVDDIKKIAKKVKINTIYTLSGVE